MPHGALKMGLIKDLGEAAQRQHTPKVAFVSAPADYTASSGKTICEAGHRSSCKSYVDGKITPCHDGHCGRGHLALPAAIPGTLVNQAAGGNERESVRFGHPSGTLKVGAEAKLIDGQWSASKVIMSRSARVLMEGYVYVPGDII